MIEVDETVLTQLPPGARRRDLMRELKMQISVRDFNDEEWAVIEAEASGTRAAIEALLEDPSPRT